VKFPDFLFADNLCHFQLSCSIYAFIILFVAQMAELAVCSVESELAGL
jgi:hypothetical protein